MTDPASQSRRARRQAASATQVRRPWRTTVRSGFQFVVGLAAAAPIIYTAIVQDDPSTATGGALVALAVAGAITRVMASPAVDDLLDRWAPWLAADPTTPGTPPVE